MLFNLYIETSKPENEQVNGKDEAASESDHHEQSPIRINDMSDQNLRMSLDDVVEEVQEHEDGDEEGDQ